MKHHSSPHWGIGFHSFPSGTVARVVIPAAARVALLLALFSAVSTPALEPLNDDGTPRSNCSNIPGITEVKLEWRGQNLVGCKVELVSARSRIRRINSDCLTSYFLDLPPEVPRQWIILSQPAGANAQVIASGNTASLTLPRAGDYTVQLTICPSGNCPVIETAGLTNTFQLTTSSGTIVIRAEAELPLRVQERPVLPPSAMQPTTKLDLTDAERSCRCQGGGGLIDPQWVTVNPWSGPNDYKLVEGYVVRSWPPITDAPFNHDLAWSGGDWYVIHDVGVVVSPDPRYYNLVSTKPEWEESPHLLAGETQGDKFPDHLRPVEGDRVSLFGFWILDCGHEPFYTEIHPVVGWAVHKNRPVRIPDNATFTFDLVTNTATATAGNNLYVPGIVSDLWFNSDTGDNTGGGNNSLAQPARCNPNYAQCLAENPGHPERCPYYLDADRNITQSPIQREYDFNIYLPKNPSDVFAEVGQTRPRAPLYVTMSNPHASDGPYPTVTRTNETVNGVTYEYLRVHLDLRGHPFSTYSRRIEAAWVYPKADNWGLAQYRVALHQLNIANDLDSKLRWPGSDGDWVLWLMLPSTGQSWTRLLDGFNNAHGTMTFNPPWETGSTDSVFRRPPLSVDPLRRLGPDILSFSPYINFWMGGYEADEGFDDDPGRISSFFYHYTNSVSTSASSHNGNFAASFTSTRIATLNNGTLSSAATQLGRHYLITCTNRINNRNPIRDQIAPLDQMGLLVEGVSGEPPWSPVDPRQLYGAGAALIGDVNRDGFPDMALGLRGTNVAAHIFLGGRNGFPPAPHAVVSLPGTSGLFRGAQPARNVLGTGDVNGDGVPDLLYGAPLFTGDQTNEGAAFLFSGSRLGAGGMLDASNAIWSVEGNSPNAGFGFALAAGDINHDGFSDVIVGAPYYQNSVSPSVPLGRVFVYLGSSNGLATSPATTLIPTSVDGASLHWFGHSVAVADLNHDGFAEVIVGAPRFNNGLSDQGAIFVYPGSASGVSTSPNRLLTGGVGNAQFGYAVAGAGDVDGDGYADVLVSAPFYGSGEFTLQEGYAAVFRGSIEGLAGNLWGQLGGFAGAHFGTDLAGLGDLNGDGLGDVAVGAPDETNPEGLRGRVSFFLGSRIVGSGKPTEAWRTWGVSGVAKPPLGVSRASDVNADGFDDALTFDPTGGGDPFARVQLVLGRGQRLIVPTAERFYRGGATEPYAFPDIVGGMSVSNMVRSGQTNATKLAALLAQVKDLYLTVQQAGGNPGGIVPMLQQLQQIMPTNLFNQYFSDVDLELGTAFYIDCGATSESTDVLGRRWVPDAPYLVTSNTFRSTFPAIPVITNTLLGDRYLPDAMLNSERWFDGAIRYQVGVPNGWYTVLLYFSENYPPGVSPRLGGTGCSNCARLFDLEVERQRTNAYNQADAALPPYGDGLGRLYTATQVPFNVQVTDGILDIAVLDRGTGNPPENAAIKGIAILGRPAPPKFTTRPRIAGTTRDGDQFGVFVDMQANLARYLAGEIPVRLQSSTNLTQWATVPNLPEVGASGASFWLSTPTNAASFYRVRVGP